MPTYLRQVRQEARQEWEASSPGVVDPAQVRRHP